MINYNIKHYKFTDIKTSMDEIDKELAEYENLVKRINISNHNINVLQNNMGKFKNSHILLKQQYQKLFETEDILLADIFDVSKGKKALGYLPNKAVKKAGRDINYIVQFAIKNNLDFHISNRNTVESISVYNRYFLRKILNDNKDILIDSGLSLDEDEFVRFVMDKPTVTYRSNPRLFILIALAFNDSRLERIA